LKFRVDPDGFFASDLELVIPILIGNVPIETETGNGNTPKLLLQMTKKFNAENLFGLQGTLSFLFFFMFGQLGFTGACTVKLFYGRNCLISYSV
jgi:hypothetical protein